MSHCKTRRANNESNAINRKQKTGNYTAYDAFQVLRSHHGTEEEFSPDSGNMSSICLHATGPITPNDTTGSLVVEWDTESLTGDSFRVFYTGTANPCLSLFKPFFFGTKGFIGNPSLAPKNVVDDSLWWKQQLISRRANFNYKSVKSKLNDLTNNSEQKMYSSGANIKTLDEKEKFQKDQLQAHLEIQDGLIKDLQVNKIGESKWTSPLFTCYWKLQNAKAKVIL